MCSVVYYMFERACLRFSVGSGVRHWPPCIIDD
jgi:hypothetical protein